ncbi:transposase [Shigella flexneri]
MKVFGEGEWKVEKTRQRTPSYIAKLHLAVDSNTHEIICADLSLNNVTDSEAFRVLCGRLTEKSGAAWADSTTTPALSQ